MSAQYVMYTPPSVQDGGNTYMAPPNVSASVMVTDGRVKPGQQTMSHPHDMCPGNHYIPGNPEDYTPISFKEAMYNYSTYGHVSNAMIYSKANRVVLGRYLQPADILMIMREDGSLGFPGGHFEPNRDASIVDGLNRELLEELGLKSKNRLTQNDFVSSAVIHKTKHVVHMYAHEVSPKDFSELEKRIPSALHFGIETWGSMRVPLYTMEDGLRGFPAFLGNRFLGNTKNNLILGIRQRQLVQPQQLSMMLQNSQQL